MHYCSSSGARIECRIIRGMAATAGMNTHGVSDGCNSLFEHPWCFVLQVAAVGIVCRHVIAISDENLCP